MDLCRKPTEELAEVAVHVEESLGYARERGRRRLVGLLETVRTEVELEGQLLSLPPGKHLSPARGSIGGRMIMREKHRVSDMATAVLARQAEARAERTGEPFEEALAAVTNTEAGRQLGGLRDGPHHDKRADRWQGDLPQKRDEERKRARREEREQAQRDAAWERFIREERRELELRKDGQLARLLGDPLPGEPPEALRRLASEDLRQAKEGLVALMSGGKVSYKYVDDLAEGDMPSRVAASRSRTAWLKERRDGWLGRRDGS